MGTLAQEVLRKMHGYEQRKEIKDVVDGAEKKAKEEDKTRRDDLKDKEADMKAGKDKRDLGDSSADAKVSKEKM